MVTWEGGYERKWLFHWIRQFRTFPVRYSKTTDVFWISYLKIELLVPQLDEMSFSSPSEREETAPPVPSGQEKPRPGETNSIRAGSASGSEKEKNPPVADSKQKVLGRVYKLHRYILITRSSHYPIYCFFNLCYNCLYKARDFLYFPFFLLFWLFPSLSFFIRFLHLFTHLLISNGFFSFSSTSNVSSLKTISFLAL